MGSGWEEEYRCLRSAGQKLGSKGEMVDRTSPSQKTNERCKYAAFRFSHQCEYPCGDNEYVRGEIKSQVQVRRARSKRKSQLSKPLHSTPTPHSRLKIPVFQMNYCCWKPWTKVLIYW